MRIGLLLLSLLFSLPKPSFAGPSPGKKAVYLKVKAASGQGVYALLRKYQLLDQPENLDLFYRINKLPQNAELIQNRSYLLPIKVHSYDGKSIRSSIGIADMALAKTIQEYNKKLTTSKIRKTDYLKDRQLWIPAPLDPTETILASNGRQNHQKSINRTKSDAPLASKSTGDDPRKQFLVASMSPINSRLVSEHKMSEAEIQRLYTRASTPATDLGMPRKVSSKTLHVPLFGPDYASVALTSSELEDQVFYIVPGHGGPDPGAIAKNVDGAYTICEDEYAYDVSLRLAKNLMEKGATVYVIVQDKNDGIRDEKYLDCDKDEFSHGGHEIPLSQKKRLKQGISKVNRLYAKHKKKGVQKQWMVSLHIDAQSEDNRQDVFFYYQGESANSKRKAIDIQNVFEQKYQQYRKDEEYTGTVSSRPLYVVRHSDPEPIFIELANIHNPEDRKRILFPKNRQLLADWITEGFLL
ncbi:MAG TPA: N-acetylmuramoyl-L-alanine amidase [Saprospiraceae bacterium]|nr:N-acetylmuramoyl-L-alanine amidase [Saprospiraceae bacterium]